MLLKYIHEKNYFKTLADNTKVPGLNEVVHLLVKKVT